MCQVLIFQGEAVTTDPSTIKLSSPDKKDLVGAFALAQYYMGIGITLQVKEKHIGKKSITECSDNELKTILHELRRTYDKQNRHGNGANKKVVGKSQ